MKRITIETETLTDEALVLLFKLIDALIDTEPGPEHEGVLIKTFNQLSEECERRFGKFDGETNDDDFSKLESKLKNAWTAIQEHIV